jgi:hypothetical protein
VAYEHSEGWGAASTEIVISGGFGTGKTRIRWFLSKDVSVDDRAPVPHFACRSDFLCSPYRQRRVREY